MKKFTILLALLLSATLGLTAWGGNVLFGAAAPLDVGSTIAFYVGYETTDTNWLATLKKDTLGDWTGVYTAEVFRSWWQGDVLAIRGGLGIGIDIQPNAAKFAAIRLAGGPFWRLTDVLRAGVMLVYDGEFYPELRVEFYPDFGAKETGGE